MDRLDRREPTVIGGTATCQARTCVTPVLQVCINANPCNPFRYSKLHLKCHTHTKPTTISHVSVTKPTPVQVALTHGRPHSDPRHITLPFSTVYTLSSQLLSINSCYDAVTAAPTRILLHSDGLLVRGKLPEATGARAGKRASSRCDDDVPSAR